MGRAVTKRQRGYRYPLDDTFFFLSLPPLVGGDGTTGEREDPVAVEGAGGRLVCSDEYMQTVEVIDRSRMQCHSLGCARIGGGLWIARQWQMVERLPCDYGTNW